ncbi:hypothetical protein EUTSA_v10015699mg [Eutrema salsugineum]|uniref:Late embryogenesis abundant protein LEA-2 subgroup domain-containing protein n=1 Tax=Eutrema salsugineum TaxID=72664 RepID=V4N8U3_EUTSA|nr:NDR1/HIN1-like protein 13 [Eutrema salsugineum]ESQ42136.1 hypothetical protein EUTSA_v10015699mg [Eutrema salsugineum]
MAVETNDNIQKWPRNAGGFVTDKDDVSRTKHPSIDTNDNSIQRSPRSSGGFVSDKDVQRPKFVSFDTIDTASSRFSVESQRPKQPPPPGTYLVQLRKEEVFRVPPPENARRYEYLSRRKHNRSTFRRCFWSFLATLLVLLILAALVVGILFLIYRPHKPLFSVSGVSIAGINLTSPSSPISPVIKVKVRAKNVNARLGLIYGKGGAIELYYDGIKLGDGEFTAFEQPAENVTVTVTKLWGLRIQLASSSRKELMGLEKKGKVPFDLRIKAPVKFKVGAVTTWTMTVTVDCKLTLDKLTVSSTVITENCVTEELSLL